MTDGAQKFDFTSVLRNATAIVGDVKERIQTDLTKYLEIFQRVTNIPDRMISEEATGDSGYLIVWRSGKRKLSPEKYDALVSWMDQKLRETADPDAALSEWVNRKAQDASDKAPPLRRRRQRVSKDQCSPPSVKSAR